ncbi:MAG: glycosyltransferase family 39 protein [Myxococcota bacterium]
MGDSRTKGLAEAAELAYREHAFLVDKQALPHPGLDAESLATLGPWLVLVVFTVLGAAWALWMKRRYAPGCRTLAKLPLTYGRYTDAVGLFLVGLGLRLWGLGTQPADSQELTYLLQVVFPREMVTDPWLASLLTLMAPHMVSPHPPLFRLILMMVLGDAHDLAWLRGPAALAGAATVPLVYMLGAKLYGRPTGLVAGALLAVSPFHIYFSQTITPYSLLGLWVAAAYLLHSDALKPGGPWGRYVTVLALGFVTHFSAAALFAPLAIDALWRGWRYRRQGEELARLWRFVAAGAVSLVPLALGSAGLFFYGDMIPHIFPMIHAMALFPPVESVAMALTAFFEGAAGFLWHGVASTYAVPSVGVMTGFGLILSALGGRKALHAREASGRVLPLGVLLFVGFFVALGVLTISSNGFFYFASRRFIPVVPVLIVLWAGGLGLMSTLMQRRGFGRAAQVAILCLLLGPPLWAQAMHLWTMKVEVVKPDMRAVADELSTQLKDGDAIATGPYVFFDFLYAYHAETQVADWYQAGGAPRWVSLPGHNHATPRRVLLSTSDIALPWHQVLSHEGVKRVWLLDVDERPYGLRELEGPGTIHQQAMSDLGMSSCGVVPLQFTGVAVSCYQVTGKGGLKDVVDVGDGDYRQVMGMAPPGSVRSHARRLAPGGAVLFGPGRPAASLDLHVMRWFEESVPLEVSVFSGDHVETHRVELTERKQRVNVPLGLPSTRASSPLRVEFSVTDQLVESRPSCFRHRRERYRRGWLDCGIYLREVALRRVEGP